MPKRKKPPEFEDRTEERQSVQVAAVISVKETEDEVWKEMVDFTTITKNGAGFTLTRECPIGRLMTMVISMPPELRVYDEDDDVYQMLGIVQTCYSSTANDTPIYHVGVAFIGKELPEGSSGDPQQCYRIVGMKSDGLWQVAEAATVFRNRKYARFWRRFEMVVSIRDNASRTSIKQDVITRDISEGGMSVWGPLEASVGDRIKISDKEHDFYAIAIVKGRADDPDDPARSTIHLEFEGSTFPVEKIRLAPETVTIVDAATGEDLGEIEVEVADEADHDEAVEVKDAEIVKF